ncbi:MAG: hypothetical protein GF344_01445 [Chitinivibrionales bacterium]|nr:hypothetical protein [Chitinivibrionales bacterium]MBD3355759.1 hypothetical protein [Chitinivibrionales bacterium]
MLTAAKETSPVLTGNDVRYTGLYLFSCLSSFAAKSKIPAIQAPHLWLKRPPVQKPLLSDFEICVYHIKKEFDQDGGDYSHAYLDLDICIHDLHVDPSDQKAIIIHFADGTSQSYSIYRNSDEEWSRRDDSLVCTEDRVITQMEVRTSGAWPGDVAFSQTFSPGIVLEVGTTRRIELYANAADIIANPAAFAFTVGEGDFNAGIAAYHFGARMYDPVVGGWLSADPVGQFWGSYAYAGGNPINAVDPDGAASVKISASGNAMAAAGAGGEVDLVKLNINAALRWWANSGLPGHCLALAGQLGLDAIERLVFYDTSPNSAGQPLSFGDLGWKIYAGASAGAWADIGLSIHIGEAGDFGVKAFGTLAAGMGVIGRLGLTFDIPQSGERFGGWGISFGGSIIALGAVAGTGVEVSGNLPNIPSLYDSFSEGLPA